MEIRRPPQLRHHATRLRSYLLPQEAYVRREITEQTDPEKVVQDMAKVITLASSFE